MKLVILVLINKDRHNAQKLGFEEINKTSFKAQFIYKNDYRCRLILTDFECRPVIIFIQKRPLKLIKHKILLEYTYAHFCMI